MKKIILIASLLMAGGVWADVGDELLRVLHSGFIGQGEKVNQFKKVLGVFFKI